MIRRMRKERGLTQERLAERTDIATDYLGFTPARRERPDAAGDLGDRSWAEGVSRRLISGFRVDLEAPSPSNGTAMLSSMTRGPASRRRSGDDIQIDR